MYGYLFANGKGRGTNYTLNPNFELYSVGSSGPNVGTSGSNVGSSGSNVGSLDPNIGSSSINKLIINKKRINKENMEGIILQICSLHYVPLVKIADKVRRNPVYLQNHILSDMVKSGKLLRKYPETPNHPNQAYKSAEE